VGTSAATSGRARATSPAASTGPLRAASRLKLRFNLWGSAGGAFNDFACLLLWCGLSRVTGNHRIREITLNDVKPFSMSMAAGKGTALVRIDAVLDRAEQRPRRWRLQEAPFRPAAAQPQQAQRRPARHPFRREAGRRQVSTDRVGAGGLARRAERHQGGRPGRGGERAGSARPAPCGGVIAQHQGRGCLHQPNLYHSCCQDRCLTLTKPVSEHHLLNMLIR
jgi:hypothetical protein